MSRLAQHVPTPLSQLLKEAPLEGLSWSVQLPASGDPLIHRLCPIDQPEEGGLSFLANAKFFSAVPGSCCACIVMPQQGVDALKAAGVEPTFAIVVCENPYLMYARLTQWFDAPRVQSLRTGQVHPSAFVDPTAVLEEGVSVHPMAVIGARCHIKAGAVIGAGAVLGEGCQIGENTLIYPRVTLYDGVQVGQDCVLHAGVVLGADGFGFAPQPDGSWSKIAQLGSVVVGDRVEIGANTTIDRGALSNTQIHDGAILDNLIMLGHNVVIGRNTAIAGCAAIAGSTHVGQQCTIAGAAMISGHLNIGDQVHISGATQVMSDIEAPGRYTSVFPAAPHRDWQKNMAILMNASDLRSRVRHLERQVDKWVKSDSTPQDPS